jgi:hypothetical protein
MPSPLVKSHLPICSVQRARELKFDLNQVATCAPPNSLQSDGTRIKGCSCYESCRFDRPEYGGFKDTRPHLIGYYLRTIEGSAKKDICACHSFVATLQPRMDDGLRMRQEGAKNYEVVKIVAQEGDPIEVKRTTVITDKAGQRRWVTKPESVIIPQFPDPLDNDPFLEYERDIIAEEEGEQVAQTTRHRPAAEPARSKA